jgi:hypothetical protein
MPGRSLVPVPSITRQLDTIAHQHGLQGNEGDTEWETVGLHIRDILPQHDTPEVHFAGQHTHAPIYLILHSCIRFAEWIHIPSPHALTKPLSPANFLQVGGTGGTRVPPWTASWT